MGGKDSLILMEGPGEMGKSWARNCVISLGYFKRSMLLNYYVWARPRAFARFKLEKLESLIARVQNGF